MGGLTSRRTLFTGVVVFLIILIGLRFCTNVSPFKSMSLLELLETYRAELEYPGLTVSNAAQNLETPQAAFEFIRDQTAYSSYMGHRQTAEVTLRTRSGNSQDRAYLLGAILNEMGWEVELRRVSRRDEVPRSGTFAMTRSPVLTEIFRRIGYDPDVQTSEGLAVERAFAEETEIIRQDVETVTQLLKDLIPYTYADYPEANSNFRRVYLFAQKDGEEELYFDPTHPDLTRPETDDAYQDIEPLGTGIELWMENSSGYEEPLLVWDGQTAGHDISLTFFPTHNTGDALTGPPDPSKIKTWTPILQVEDEIITGRPFTVNGFTPGLSLKPPTQDIYDLKPLDVSQITNMALHNIDSSGFPYIEAQVELVGQGEGVLLPQNLTVTDNGVQVPVTVGRLTTARGGVSIVSDVSGSMETIGAFEIAKQAIIRLSGMLSPDTSVSLISFAYLPETEVELQPLRDGAQIRTAVQGLSSRGYTGIYKALNMAVLQEGLQGGTIVLMTDGEDTEGGSLENTVKALNDKNIRVVGIGLGSNADFALIEKIAEGTDGIAIKVKTITDLDDVYATIGRELSRFATLRYKAPDCAVVICETSVSGDPAMVEGADSIDLSNSLRLIENADAVETVAPKSRVINVRLKSTSLEAVNTYKEPDIPLSVTPNLFLRFETGAHSGNRASGDIYQVDKSIRRNLYDLDHPDIGWALSGRTQIYVDQGSIAPSISTAAYITNWIEVLRHKDGINTTPDELALRPSYDLVSTVNGLRTLTGLGSGTDARLGDGPNIYLHRFMYLPQNEDIIETERFDVVERWARGVNAKNAEDTQRVDIAMMAAEGRVLGGEDGISAFITASGSLEVEQVPDAASGRDIDAVQALFSTDELWAITSDQPGPWQWYVDADPARQFAAFHTGNGLFAKGSSIEQLAAEFDKIDKLLELYQKAAGKVAGLNVYQGGLVDQIAGMKREENKLWCYSTLIMGHVNEAIEGEQALLNVDPEAAKAKSKSLCKMDYDPENLDQALAKRAAKEFGNTVKGWVQKDQKARVKDIASGIGGPTAGGLFDYGETAYGFNKDIFNPAFGIAMGEASGVGR